MKVPPTSLERPFLLVPTRRQVKAYLPALPIGLGSPHRLALDAAGSGARPPLVCAAHFATPIGVSPPPHSRRRPLSTPPRGEVAMIIGRPLPLKYPDWLQHVQGSDPGDVINVVCSLANVPGSRDTDKGGLRGRGC